MSPVREESDGGNAEYTSRMIEQSPSNAPVREKQEKKGSTWSVFIYGVIALGLALLVRFFIATPYIVSGSSMEHTFNNFDYLIVDRLTYDFRPPQRGEVIVFGLPQDLSRDLIKRVIGLPGETVDIHTNHVTITNVDNPNGFVLDEPYVSPENIGGPDDTHVTLGADQYFVLGDHRNVSADSRIWGILPRQDIIGRVFVRLFPFTRIGLLPGQAEY
jgi:signal peptidase I